MEISLRNRKAIVTVGADVIFRNAASKKNVCLIDPKKHLKANAEGAFKPLSFALKDRIRKFVHSSAGSA